MQHITKRFGYVTANRDVDLEIYPGEILSILGENGSGKTTLMNMIAGIYYPDEGEIFINGEPVVISSPRDAFEHRIGMIHQHFKLVDLFTAAENIVLGVRTGKRYDLNEVNRQVKEIADRYGFIIDPKKKVYDMSVSEKQTVEILKVLYRGADILILDEPTAVLTVQEIKRLFDVLKRMREEGKSVIIITHKLNEVMEVSDRVAILRKGEHIATVSTSETNEAALTEMMVGKKITLNIDRTDPVNPTPRLMIKGMNLFNSEGVQVLKDISFTANGGEILGIAGIAGSGQRELLEAIAGLQPLKSGEITFSNPKKDKPVSLTHKTLATVMTMAAHGCFHDPKGRPVDFTGLTNREITRRINAGEVIFNEDEDIDLRNRTPLQIRELGVRLSFVPEDRLGMGLVGDMNLTDNTMLRSYRKGPRFFLDRKSPRALAQQIVDEL